MNASYYQGKNCVVTGAASGIGLALSNVMLEAGASVCLSDRDGERLADAVRQLSAHGDRVSSAVANVCDEGEVARLVDAAAGRGPLDLMFNNAGIGGTFPFAAATLDQWRRIIDVNLWGVIHGVRAAAAVMRLQGKGHIVNVASLAGLLPLPYQSLYNTTKYAVVGLSETLRFELADDGIAVSVVCPGAVATPIWGKPILGPAQDVAPPADAMPVADAARAILDGVARRQGVIVMPESAEKAWRDYWRSPEEAEPLLRDMARQRRKMFAYSGWPN